jgi:hypothetical protein
MLFRGEDGNTALSNVDWKLPLSGGEDKLALSTSIFFAGSSGAIFIAFS